MEAIEAAEIIIKGPEYFDCEKLNARIRKSCCIARQRKAEHPKLFYVHPGYPPDFQHCLDCPQGREIMKGEKIPMKKGICKNCTRPGMPIVGRGLCPACYRYKDDQAGLNAARERLKPKTMDVAAFKEKAQKAAEPGSQPTPPSSEKKPKNGTYGMLADLLTYIGRIPGVKIDITIQIH